MIRETRRWSLASIWPYKIDNEHFSLVAPFQFSILCLYSKPSDKIGIKVPYNSLRPSCSFVMNGWERVTLANIEEWSKKAKRIEFWGGRGAWSATSTFLWPSATSQVPLREYRIKALVGVIPAHTALQPPPQYLSCSCQSRFLCKCTHHHTPPYTIANLLEPSPKLILENQSQK